MKAIYKTSLKSTGRVVYVGQTKKVNDVGTKYFGSGMHRLFNLTYIREHFVSEIITITEDQNEANDLERYYIDYYCTLAEYGGFNVSHGGLGPSLPGENNNMYGKGHLVEGGKNGRAKKCILGDKTFDCIKDAYDYAVKYDGYNKTYQSFRIQFKD